MMAVPLPETTARRSSDCTHPGLMLDRFADSWHPGIPPGGLSERTQTPTVREVARLSAAAPSEWPTWSMRHKEFLRAVEATDWTMVTAGPLALHLSRASALENAGTCLHRVYGFAYLPGTGLKGLARSYAETVWAAAEEDDGRKTSAEEAATRRTAAERKIRRVFGHQNDSSGGGEAGEIVFHDAWPAESWPRLVPDIVNNHHTKYYGAGTDDFERPPGDWEEPNMVQFLTVAPGQKFRFAVAPRRAGEPAELAQQAREWLTAALVEEGAGAKTAAGYGGFVPTVDHKPSSSPARVSFEAELTLVMPAFLAGPDQRDPGGCRLRSATLRGLLRWWWRTMHAGFVDVPTLRAMESAVWGSTTTGGPVRVTVEEVTPPNVLPFDRRAIIDQNKLPRPANSKTSQGLIYHSYGTDDGHLQRQFVCPGTRWRVRITAREGRLFLTPPMHCQPRRMRPVGMTEILKQAEAALWLLAQYGGIGTKSRRGFGSLDWDNGPSLSLSQLHRDSAAFQEHCGFVNSRYQPLHVQSPSLGSLSIAGGNAPTAGPLLGPITIPVGWGSNYWLVLDLIGTAAQGFAQQLKHRNEKKGLGLPRRIGQPRSGHCQLSQRVGNRHASPTHYHVSGGGKRPFEVRLIAFPSPELSGLNTNAGLLGQLLQHLQASLPGLFNANAVRGQALPWNPPVPAAASRPAPTIPTSGDVEAEIVPDPNPNKNRLYATYGGYVGPVTNADMLSPRPGISDKVRLHYNLTTTSQISFSPPRPPKAAKNNKRKS